MFHRQTAVMPYPLAALVLLWATGACSRATAAPKSLVVPPGPTVKKAQLITPQSGWALTDKGLVWTNDDGRTWSAVGPPAVSPVAVKSVYFFDVREGWMVAANHTSTGAESPGLLVYRTTDGGSSWASSPVAADAPVYSSYGSSYMEFISPLEGWLVADLGSNANFSYGEVFHTADGGSSWMLRSQATPGPIHFTSSSDGWMAGREFSVTHDGGVNWQRQTLSLPATASAISAFGRGPVRSRQANVIPVMFQEGSTVSVGFYTTGDGGRSWTVSPTVHAPTSVSSSVLPAVPVDPATWVVYFPNGTQQGTLAVTVGAGASWTYIVPQGLPAGGVETLDFATRDSGWALATLSGCLSFKSDCYSVTKLYITSDGGRTWTQAAF